MMKHTSHPWLQRSRIFPSSLLGAAVMMTCPAQAASDFTPLNGTWIVSAEQDGKPGRGMAVDIQDGTLVMQVYNYQANGHPTFHLAVGAVNGNQVITPLNSYQGGRYFGSGPLSGTEDSNAGNVEINFTSASQATVRFPGEQPVAMQRFRFESTPQTDLPSATWLLSLLDSSGQAVRSGLGSTTASNGEQRFSLLLADGSTAQTLCSYSLALEGFNCLDNSGSAGIPVVKAQVKTALNQISGYAQWGAVQYRLVGKRIGSKDGLDISTPTSEEMPVPNSGTWIVSGEKNGKPGRGMAIDVQTGTLVMQVYNYQADGKATFHLAVGSFSNGQASAHLKSYQGGRYFGSGPLSGTEATDAGEVFLQFTSPTQGYVRFPGESAVAIERYQFAPQAPDLHSLMGTWSFSESTNHESSNVKLTKVEGDFASTAGGGVRCYFLNPTAALVRCIETFSITGRGSLYLKDYRFSLQGDIGIGKALKAGALVVSGTVPDDSAANSGSLTALRIEDRNGVKLGLGAPF